MNNAKRRRVVLLAGFAALCLVSLGLLGTIAFERKALGEMGGTLRAQQKLAALLERQRDADVGSRSYRLTGEPALLAPFSARGAGFAADLASLEPHFGDEPEKLVVVRRVRDLAARHDRLLAGIVARHRAGAAVPPALLDRPSTITDAMRREIVAQMKTEEAELRARGIVIRRQSWALYVALFLVNVWIVGLFILVFRDMQERLAEAIGMQDALQSANEGIRTEAQRRQELEARLSHLQKMEAMGHLSNVIAHDFKNMIGGIVLALENVRARLSPRDLVAQDDIDLALSGTARATDLANRLLALSRKQALHARPTSINAVIIGISDLLHRTIGRHRPIQVTLAEDLPLVMANPEELETAIVNLCLNARDAMPNGGRVTLETRTLTLSEPFTARYPEASPGEYVAVLVGDTGGGMSPDVAARAFDPFYSTKDDADGLGLSHVHGFVTQSGGHIAIFSAEGRGTTMKFILPRIADPSVD